MKKKIISIWIVLIVVFASNAAYSQSFISPVFTFDTKAPVTNVVSPNSGQVVNNSSPLQVTWTATDTNLKPNPISILLILQPGNFSYPLAQNLPNTGTSGVNLPAINSTQAKIRVVAKDMFGNPGFDESNAFFTINGNTDWVTVQGTVKDIATGTGIGGATVTLTGQTQNYTTTSQPGGSYNFGSILSGLYNLSASVNGYQNYNEYVLITGPTNQTININLSSGSTNSLTINSSLTAYADSIAENPANVFTLIGNVSINTLLYFTGAVTIDKRSNLVKPEISGSGTIFTKNIPGVTGDYLLKSSSVSFVYMIDDKNLEPKSYAGIIDGTPSFGGFNVTIGQFIIDPAGDFVECKTIVQMPYPIKDIQKELELQFGSNIPLYINKVASSIILSKIQGIDKAANISIKEINLGIVKVEDLTLFFNTAEQRFGGTITIQIPGGTEGSGDRPDSLNGFNTDTLSKDMGNLPVEIRDENGNTLRETDFGEFTDMQDALGLKFLKIGFEIEFLQGAINKLIGIFGAKIPIGTTGLFITEMTVGVEDFAGKDWKIIGNVDIETGLEVPGLGSPVKLDNFGVSIHPINYFKGSGTFKVFDQTVQDGFLEYNYNLSSLKGQCNLNLLGIIKGEQKLNLQGGSLSGSSLMSIQTPGDLPWYLNWAENVSIGSGLVELHNYTFQAEARLAFMNMAFRLTYGKESFPWFHYELGNNLQNLSQVWKGHGDANQTTIFEVPENSAHLLVIAMDSINPQLFDFSLISPTGKIYNSGNTPYQQFPGENQTLMEIDMPVDGDWQFTTAYTGDVALHISVTNQKPTGIINMPASKQILSNEISLSFNDYADTLHVEVFYDTDRKNFDGSRIDDFTVVNNATITFVWQNESLPNGEYFIYTRVDDGKNTPSLQYAPGSILVQHGLPVETPQNMTAVQQADSVIVSWNAPIQTDIYSTTVYFKDKSTQKTEEESVTDSTHLVLKGLAPGRGYEIWCRFRNVAESYSPKSMVQSFVFNNSPLNNPPYFTQDRDSTFIFIAGEPATYTLLASDADGNAFSFTLPGDTLVINIVGNQLSWTPALNLKGVFKVMVVVNDGSSTDTTWQKLVVYTPEQMNINLSFSSVRMYEQDNMFVVIRNFSCPDANQTVVLMNLHSLQQTNVVCSRVNEFEYIGQFELTFAKSIAIAVANGDSLRASYTWNGTEYKTFACYDSLPQPSDQTSPGIINDLVVERLPGNQLKLSWTATGNDGAIGKAFRYDIRYAYEPVTTENIYLTALLIVNKPYPSQSGERDSLTISLSDLQQNAMSDSVFFSIKAGDEMLNWSALGNSPGKKCLPDPANITAQVTGIFNIHLNWTGPLPNQPFTGGFLHYNLFRGINNGSLLLYQTEVTQTNFTDSLRDFPDGSYQYAIQAIFETGNSDTIFAPIVDLKRFANVNILLALDGIANYEGITFHMTGLDTLYGQTFDRSTNYTGLLLLGNVFKASYAIEVIKAGYISVHDTILVSTDPAVFGYVLSLNIPAAISLQNVTVQNGQNNCYEATQTITVAGGGTEFIVQSGAIANMVAGMKITLLPHTTVNPGGYLHAFITPNNQYCSSFKNHVGNEPETSSKNSFFKVYPNPTTGSLILEFTRDMEFSTSQVHVYNLFGADVLNEEINSARVNEFSLRDQPPGIYIIRVINGNQAGTAKIIKL